MSELLYSTGNPIVDQLGTIHLDGNITPHTWFQTIKRPTGKPYLLAINILADIVYWYRPTPIREESTMQILGYKKKFKADLLQRNYNQLAEFFDVSKKQATEAVVHLEKIGVVKRHLRTITENGVTMNNVLFIELKPDGLKKVTFPTLDNTEVGDTYPPKKGEAPPKKGDTLPPKKETPSPRKKGDPPPKKGETNTEITTKTSTEITTKSNYGEFVTLTSKEYESLVTKYGKQPADGMIEILDNYKGANGKKYASDYRAILSWVVTKWKEQNGGKQNGKTKTAEELAREINLPF